MALSGTIAQAFVANVLDVDTYARSPLGSTMVMEDGRGYKYVQFAGTNAVAVGQVVCYVTADVTNTVVDLATNARGAGVAVVAVPAGTVQFGWVQTHGVASLAAAVGGTPTAGAPLTTTGATNGTMTAVAAATSSSIASFITATGNVVTLNFPW